MTAIFWVGIMQNLDACGMPSSFTFCWFLFGGILTQAAIHIHDGSKVKAIIPRPAGLDLSGLIGAEDAQANAFRMANTAGDDPRSMFNHWLTAEMAKCDLYVYDLNVWTKHAGQPWPTSYHSDLLYSLPFKNRIVQLWIPLACEGAKEEVDKAMLRLDDAALADGWGCPSGYPSYLNVWTGEEVKLSFPYRQTQIGMILEEDLDSYYGGGSINVGDTLLFHNSHCHYTVPSKAYRLGLAVRIVDGAPISSGYFTERRPEFPTNLGGSQNLEFLREQFAHCAAGDPLPLEPFYRVRMNYDPNTPPPPSLDSRYQEFAQYIAQSAKRILSDG